MDIVVPLQLVKIYRFWSRVSTATKVPSPKNNQSWIIWLKLKSHADQAWFNLPRVWQLSKRKLNQRNPYWEHRKIKMLDFLDFVSEICQYNASCRVTYDSYGMSHTVWLKPFQNNFDLNYSRLNYCFRRIWVFLNETSICYFIWRNLKIWKLFGWKAYGRN